VLALHRRGEGLRLMGVERLDAPVPQGFGDAVVERERERRVARRLRGELSPLDELLAELRVVAQSNESGVGEQESLRESVRVRVAGAPTGAAIICLERPFVNGSKAKSGVSPLPGVGASTEH
jgi:hypothetical protein